MISMNVVACQASEGPVSHAKELQEDLACLVHHKTFSEMLSSKAVHRLTRQLLRI